MKDVIMIWMACALIAIWMRVGKVEDKLSSIDSSLKVIAEYFEDGNPTDTLPALEHSMSHE